MKIPRLLIVDDDHKILNLLSEFLSRNGFLVSKADSAEQAQNILQYFTMDLMILDIMMPVVSGIEFAKQVKLSTDELPIILLTALSKKEGITSGLNDVKIDDYITKPFDPYKLLKRVSKLIISPADEKQEIYNIGKNIYYDSKTKNFVKNNVIIKLSFYEQKLLKIFYYNQNIILHEKILSSYINTSSDIVNKYMLELINKAEDDSSKAKYLYQIDKQSYVLHT